VKILVTGGAGFIGSNLVERLLLEGHEVSVFDEFNDFYNPEIKRANLSAVRDQIRVVVGDLRDADAVNRTFAEVKPDTVVHLAARAGVRPSIEEPELYINCNVNGTFHVLDASKKHGVERFVFASSSSVYGVNEKVPFAETDLISRTISPYAATKLAGEQLCSNYAYLYGIRTVCLRFFTVYGPRQRPDLAISKFTRLIDEGKPIDRYGDGSTSRDYTYIDDIIQGLMGGIHYKDKDFDIFNLGGTETVTLNELIEAVEAALGKKAKIHVMPEQPGDVPRTNADITKARKMLGYEPTTAVRDGVAKYVEWYRKMRGATYL
jgi:UDP-glucuronate 4-epimerase